MHVNLAGTDSPDKHLEWCQRVTCSSINQQINVFDIVDDILVVGYDADGRGHDRTVRQLMQIFHQENLKHNKFNVIENK